MNDKSIKKNLNTKLLILIISPPGDLQIGLQALLTTHLDVDVLAVGEGSSALKVIEKYHPAVVILDNDLPKNVAPKIIHDIKINWPDITCIILVNEKIERQLFLETGGELIVIKGLPGAKLVLEIKKLLHIEKYTIQGKI